jgi:hypothetical protein
MASEVYTESIRGALGVGNSGNNLLTPSFLGSGTGMIAGHNLEGGLSITIVLQRNCIGARATLDLAPANSWRAARRF